MRQWQASLKILSFGIRTVLHCFTRFLLIRCSRDAQSQDFQPCVINILRFTIPQPARNRENRTMSRSFSAMPHAQWSWILSALMNSLNVVIGIRLCSETLGEYLILMQPSDWEQWFSFGAKFCISTKLRTYITLRSLCWIISCEFLWYSELCS